MNRHQPPHMAERVDVDAVRSAHPLVEVVTASGVGLTRRGHGWMGCCPFHEDTTPSLSVDGVPGKFHCFGCGAHGDVIDYITRLTGLPFRDAVHALDAGGNWTRGAAVPANPAPVPPRITTPRFTVPPERAHQINQLAWEHFTRTPAAAHAAAYLRHHRGLDLTALHQLAGREQLVGYAAASWQSLARHLLAHGVGEQELVELDLCHRTRHGQLVDVYRGRLIVPVRDEHGDICGFLGRDTTGHPGVPKYRNPTRTPVFDKSTALYRPTVQPLDADATLVVVEGPLDALAVAAAAATAGQPSRWTACSTGGVTVSTAQADAVLAIHPGPPVIALDADSAGHDGTSRWLQQLCCTRSRPALVTTLPPGTDPAAWLAEHGTDGLGAFDRHHALTTDDIDVPSGVVPHLPGPELVHLVLDRKHTDPTAAVLATITPLTTQLGPAAAEQLLGQVVAEMTRQGWNPHHHFEQALHRHLATTRGQQPPAEPHAAWVSGRPASTDTAPTLARPDGPATPSLT